MTKDVQEIAISDKIRLGFGVFIWLACLILNILLTTFSSSIKFLRNDPQITYVIMFFTSDLFSIGPAIYTILLPGPIREFLIQKITDNMPFQIGNTSSS
ncbi:hypothetical protein PRIPAC_96890 [Pristionchus pacificus]|uniref:Uncharacterized protein n=1 Tax=Pristionchus pacificus TaxID=54126 RepID=A0A2A6CGN6_PRIPA|nr:hypothetical protein PRIPAC_96890 [Pristionchus pacificus]|eukprot:PDM77372.1 hypothetical protein PRIPAC_33102 [Pristionchus pacificus]